MRIKHVHRPAYTQGLMILQERSRQTSEVKQAHVGTALRCVGQGDLHNM